jgi:hypothetical protein
MKLKSKQFNQQATDLAKLMYWRNVKLKLAIAIIVIAILLYITVPLIINATQKYDSSSSSGNSGNNTHSSEPSVKNSTVTPIDNTTATKP